MTLFLCFSLLFVSLTYGRPFHGPSLSLAEQRERLVASGAIASSFVIEPGVSAADFPEKLTFSYTVVPVFAEQRES